MNQFFSRKISRDFQVIKKIVKKSGITNKVEGGGTQTLVVQIYQVRVWDSWDTKKGWVFINVKIIGIWIGNFQSKHI